MKFIQGYDRTQVHLFPVCLDQSIDADNEVRLIEQQGHGQYASQGQEHTEDQ